MRLQQLKIGDFRNIEEAQIDLNPHFNAITGANGSGKTSILEAIYALGHGRSFRSRLAQPLIRQGESEYLVFARCLTQDKTAVKLGLTKGAQAPQIHINGESLSSLSELARLFPVVEIDAASLSIIDDGPAQRRGYLDWGVFHVEQFSGSLWARFRRVLQQRNSLLKSPAQADWDFWDSEFVGLSEQMDQARRGYFDRLLPAIGSQLEMLMGANAESIQLDYYPGWSSETENLADALVKNRSRELVLGRTLKGSHCADLRFSMQGEPIRDRFSRGQKKLFVTALKFAQVKLYNERHFEQAVLLLDDFAAELDLESMKKVRAALGKLDCQIIAAAVDAIELEKLNPYPDSHVFHVEQGKINRLMESVQSG